MPGQRIDESASRRVEPLPDGKRIGRAPGIGEQGIDDLYQVSRADVDYVIVEYKFGSSTLKQTKDGLQMSDEWLVGGRGEKSRLLDSLANDIEMSRRVADSLEAGRVERWLLHTDPYGRITVQVLDKSGKAVEAPSRVSKILRELQ